MLQWPIREATRVALQRRSDRVLDIVSHARRRARRRLDVPLALVADRARPYDQVRGWFDADPARHWAAYIAGVFHVLAREHGVYLSEGATLVVESDVPEGKGVSSSAALEAATMEAVLAAWHLDVPPRRARHSLSAGRKPGRRRAVRRDGPDGEHLRRRPTA